MYSRQGRDEYKPINRSYSPNVTSKDSYSYEPLRQNRGTPSCEITSQYGQSEKQEGRPVGTIKSSSNKKKLAQTDFSNYAGAT